MIRKIKASELPETLTPEIIDILAIMANEFPKTSFEWNEVSVLLEKRGQLRTILDRALELKRKQDLIRESLLTDEERKIEAEKIKKSLLNRKFSGNMGEPEN